MEVCFRLDNDGGNASLSELDCETEPDRTSADDRYSAIEVCQRSSFRRSESR